MLAGRGRVREAGVANPRYIGHKIGIHDLKGRKVGTPGPARNREHLFVVELGVAAARGAVAPGAGKRGRLPRGLKLAG